MRLTEPTVELGFVRIIKKYSFCIIDSNDI